MTIDGRLPVSEARKEDRAILGSVAKGGDPLATRRAAEAAQENTLRAIGDRYLASRAGRELRSIDQRRKILERLIYPKLGRRPIESIKRSEVAPARADRDQRALAHGRMRAVSEDRFHCLNGSRMTPQPDHPRHGAQRCGARARPE
jgi:hypothetical protein